MKSSQPQLEKIDFREFKFNHVFGVDEVGRGCLAGPVYAAAVCFNSKNEIPEVADSKLLSESRREEISDKLKKYHHFCVGIASVEEIDQINILNASLLAMRRAVEGLEQKIGYNCQALLIDGNQKIPNFERNQITVIKGDLRCEPISAASIIAKVARDQFMKKLATDYPMFGFEKHKGYASELHREKIKEFGPNKLHRKTFKGVREYL